ncbi:hypothetical protein ABBQ38_006929 [Trebouxia sp. C0009 RCD-2024]
MQRLVPTSGVLDEVLVASADRVPGQDNKPAKDRGAGSRRSDDPESQEASASPLLRVTDAPAVSSPRSRPTTAPLLAAVLSMAAAAKVELPLNQDKTAAVLAELRRPADLKELRTSQRLTADHPTEQTSGMSVFSQVALSEVLTDDLEVEPKQAKAKWYRRISWWQRALPVLATCYLLVIAALFRKFGPGQKIRHLEWWRLCFFLSTLAPICWATSLAVKLLVIVVESQLFIAKNALYFIAAVKVLGCWILFCAANVAKALGAKRMASHFHKQTHFQKMRDAIKKEYYLLALAQPRRDSKALGEASVGSNPSRSFSSAFRPSFFKTGASIAKSASEAAQMGPGTASSKPRRSSLHLSADSSATQSNSLHNPGADSMANISVGLGTAAGLPQGTVVQAEGVNVDPKQEAQAAPIGDLEHHNEQEHRKAPGQSHWAKLRLAHRTAAKFKPAEHADVLNKVLHSNS